MTAKACSTHMSQFPVLGIFVSNPVKVPRIRYGNPKPKEKTKNDMNPKNKFPLSATEVSNANTGGPMQGAAKMPTNIPAKNNPKNRIFLNLSNFCNNPKEMRIWNTPNIDSAKPS